MRFESARLETLRKAVLLAESLPQRLKAAKQSKVLTAALEALRHPKGHRATPKPQSDGVFPQPVQSCRPMPDDYRVLALRSADSADL